MQTQLTEEMRRLMGIAPREHGGLPVLFQKGEFRTGQAPKAKTPVTESREQLDEGSMRLYQNVKEMSSALDRAHRGISRVNASILRQRESSQNGAMNEKARADMYRLDQEVANALDSIKAAQEALLSMEKAKRIAEADRKQARIQGRR